VSQSCQCTTMVVKHVFMRKIFVFSYYLQCAQNIFLSSQKEFVSTYYTSSQNKSYFYVLRPFQFSHVELGWNLHIIPSKLWDCSVSPSEVNILYTNLRAKDCYIRSCDKKNRRYVTFAIVILLPTSPYNKLV